MLKIRAALGACSLGQWPTPLEASPALARAAGVEALWLKREDRSSPRYGGNKVRGLEFLLAGPTPGAAIVTAGGTGSTHCLATAIHARAVGFHAVLAQYPQPETDTTRAVRDACAREASLVRRSRSWFGFPRALVGAWIAAGRLGPRRWIPVGGAHPRAVVGHFLAGLELAEQLPDPPDAVVAPLGSTGTVAGLCLAIARLGWPTEVIGVRVAPRIFANGSRALRLGYAARRLIAGLIEPLPAPRAPLVIDGLGRGYGHPTPAGDRAMSVAAQHGVTLDPTYGAKAFAALDGLAGRGFRRIVFWHTFAAP